MRNLRTFATALALMIALGISAIGIVPVTASTEETGDVLLYDVHAAYAQHGIAAPTASTDWQFYVETPSYVALDDSDLYWNFTVYADCLDVVGATNHTTFKVYIYIYDGATNLTANSGTITVNKAARVYGNISIAKAQYEVMVQNGSAALYVKLVNGTTPSTLKDYYTGTIRTDTYGMIGVIWMMIPVMFMFVIVMGLMGWLTNSLGYMGRAATGQKGHGKDCRKKH